MLMRKKLRLWEFTGFLIVCAVGTLLPLLYRRTGENLFVAAFVGVNESVWERMKLLYVPYFVFTMLEFTVFVEAFRNFFAAKAAAGLAGMLFIPLLHYSLNGMFGAMPRWSDTAIFFLSTAAMYLLGCRLLTTFSLRGTALQLVSCLLLWGLMLLFIFFTYRTPHLPLFRDGVTLRYGVSAFRT